MSWAATAVPAPAVIVTLTSRVWCVGCCWAWSADCRSEATPHSAFLCAGGPASQSSSCGGCAGRSRPDLCVDLKCQRYRMLVQFLNLPEICLLSSEECPEFLRWAFSMFQMRVQSGQLLRTGEAGAFSLLLQVSLWFAQCAPSSMLGCRRNQQSGVWRMFEIRSRMHFNIVAVDATWCTAVM